MSEPVLEYQQSSLQKILPISKRNFPRVQSMSMIVGIVGLILAVTDLIFRPINEMGHLLLLISHSFLVFYMLVGIVFCLVNKKREIPRVISFLFGLCTFLMLLIGSAGDQLLFGTISVFLYGTLALFLIVIYYPVDAIVLGVIGITGFIVTIYFTQPDKGLVVSHVINGSIVTIVAVAFSVVNYKFIEQDIKNKNLINEKHLKIKELLENILPLPIIKEIEDQGASKPKMTNNVTVVFVDFVGFSRITKQLNPISLVKKLNQFFTEFDGIIDRYFLEKVKTIGDGYMFAGGLFSEEDQLESAVLASKEIIKYVTSEDLRNQENQIEWHIRLGVHVGPTIAGIIGKRKFVYDLWGDTVNIAARIERGGIEGKINVSEEVVKRLKGKFNFIQRGTFALKNVGNIKLFVLED